MKTILLALVMLTACTKSAPLIAPPLEVPVGASAADGIDRGNGTDYISFDDRGAWFNGKDKTFKYCVEIEPNFGATLTEARDAVADAIAQWKAYAEERASNSRITFNGQLAPSCDDVDLTVYFGRSFDRVSKVATPHGLGGAVRETADRATAWGSGFVWITNEGSLKEPGDGWKPRPDQKLPDWSHPGSLRAVVRHEFGHVFGTEHVDGTIMDENLALDLVMKKPEDARLPMIDGERQLLRPGIEYEGHLGMPEHAAENFEILFGRKPVGEVHAVLLPNLELSVTDGVGTHTLSTGEIDGGYAGGELKFVFQGRNPAGSSIGGSGWVHGASTQLSEVESSTGAKFNGIVEENMSSYLERDEVTNQWHAASGYVIKIMLPNKTARVIFASFVR